MCCNEDDSYDKCLKDCGLPDDSLQTEPCGNICPGGKLMFMSNYYTKYEVYANRVLFGVDTIAKLFYFEG